MKYVALFLLLIIAACQNGEVNKNVIEEVKKEIQKVDVDSISSRAISKEKSIAKLKKDKVKKVVKKELAVDPRKMEIKNRILRESAYPSEKVLIDSMFTPDRYEKCKKATLELNCKESVFLYPKIFNQQDIEANAIEAAKIELPEGESMCITDLNFSDKGFAKLLFSKSEGGHLSDAISLQFYPKDKNIIQRLTLTSNYAREGHYTEFNSVFLTNRQIKRVILNYYTSEEFENGPYVETTQIFQLNTKGSIDFVSENIVKFNFEEYLQDDDLK